MISHKRQLEVTCQLSYCSYVGLLGRKWTLKAGVCISSQQDPSYIYGKFFHIKKKKKPKPELFWSVKLDSLIINTNWYRKKRILHVLLLSSPSAEYMYFWQAELCARNSRQFWYTFSNIQMMRRNGRVLPMLSYAGLLTSWHSQCYSLYGSKPVLAFMNTQSQLSDHAARGQ